MEELFYVLIVSIAIAVLAAIVIGRWLGNLITKEPPKWR